MASESNATLHKAMQLHMGNLKMLSKPLNELQREIPSMEDIDEDSESNITEVQTMTKKVRIYQNSYCKVASSRPVFYSILNSFGQRLPCIGIKNSPKILKCANRDSMLLATVQYPLIDIDTNRVSVRSARIITLLKGVLGSHYHDLMY